MRAGAWGRALRASGASDGVTLLEVLVTALVVGIAAVGLALMYGSGNTFVVAKGDNRVALGLVQQKIEQLKSLTFNCIPVNDPSNTAPPPGVPGCVAAGDPRYVYTQGPAVLANRAFTRLTCVEWVSDTDFNAPAYGGGLTGTPCPVGAATTTKRITVIVTPAQRESDPVVVQAWVTAAGP